MNVRRNSWQIIFVAATMLTSKGAFAVERCELIVFGVSPSEGFALERPEKNATYEFVAYVGEVLDENMIGTSEVIRLIQGLEEDLLLNPIDIKAIPSEKQTAGIIHLTGFDRLIRAGQIDNQKLKYQLEKMLVDRKQKEESRKVVHDETEDRNLGIEWNRIEPGKYRWLKKRVEDGVSVETEHEMDIPYAFEMMSTKVTQKQWLDVMGGVPNVVPHGEGAEWIEYKGKKVFIQPNHPVVNVSVLSVFVFANRLSELHNLEPVYDLSEIELWLSAAKGYLQPKGRDQATVRFNNLEGNYYRSEGFRLPAYYEKIFVASRKSEKPRDNTIPFAHMEDVASARSYEWFEENSGGKLQEVADLRPLMVDGGAFYDLLGNASEYAMDIASPDSNMATTFTDNGVIHHGADYSGRLNASAPNVKKGAVLGQGDIGTGFRLVRTLEVEE